MALLWHQVKRISKTTWNSVLEFRHDHAGDDMYRFRDGCRPFLGSFYLDFDMENDVVDMFHGWLNY